MVLRSINLLLGYLEYDYEVLNAIGQCTVRGSAVSVGHIQRIHLPPLAKGYYVVRTGMSVSRFAVPE